jgi:CBS domain-containing protein
LAFQDGIHLPSHATLHQTSQRTVAQVMRRSPEVLSARMIVKDAMEQARSAQLRIFAVMDRQYFLGMLTVEELERAFADGREDQPLTNLVETARVPHVHMDHPLHLALERMSAYHLDVLPVVHRADIHKLEGIVTLSDVLDSYGVNAMDSAQL